METIEKIPPPLATELWFTAKDEAGVQYLRECMGSGDLTKTVRLGNRSAETLDQKGGFEEGQFITLKIKRLGEGFDAFEKRAVVRSSVAKKLGEVTDEDLDAVLLDGKTKEEIRLHLEQIYHREVTDDEIISLIDFQYLERIENASELIADKVLTPSLLARDNPKDLQFEDYVLPLIEHDYPAKTATMWNATYQKFGLKTGNNMLVGNPEYTREILEVLKRDPKYLGGGAGVGFKDEVFKYLEELDPLAKSIGSVNFILKTPEGKLCGYNTDGTGYAMSLEGIFKSKNEELAGKKALMLGAGGTGNSIAFALAEKGMNVVILNRTVSKAEELAKRINAHFGKELARSGNEEETEKEISDAAAIINVSTKGASGATEEYSALAPAILPATPENILKNLERADQLFKKIPAGTVLSDIVLTNNGTPFLNAAKAAGFETLDGIPMVVNQGVEAFWILHKEELIQKGISKEDVAAIMKEAAYK